MSENAAPPFNIMAHASCVCFRKDPGDPAGMIPASVKLEQLEAIFLMYQFIEWSANRGTKQIEWVREKIKDNLGWNDEEFEACRKDALAMYNGFRAASDRYLLEMPKPRIALLS